MLTSLLTNLLSTSKTYLWFWGPWSVERSRGSPIFSFLISSTYRCDTPKQLINSWNFYSWSLLNKIISTCIYLKTTQITKLTLWFTHICTYLTFRFSPKIKSEDSSQYNELVKTCRAGAQVYRIEGLIWVFPYLFPLHWHVFNSLPFLLILLFQNN